MKIKQKTIQGLAGLVIAGSLFCGCNGNRFPEYTTYRVVEEQAGIPVDKIFVDFYNDGVIDEVSRTTYGQPVKKEIFVKDSNSKIYIFDSPLLNKTNGHAVLSGVEYSRKQMAPEESKQFDEEFKEIANRRLRFLESYKGGNQK